MVSELVWSGGNYLPLNLSNANVGFSRVSLCYSRAPCTHRVPGAFVLNASLFTTA